MKVEKFFVAPYRLVNGRPQPGERRLARSAAHAEAVAERLTEHWAGAVAFGVIVDLETGEIGSPREVCSFRASFFGGVESGEMHDPREFVVYGAVSELQGQAAA